MPLIRFCPVCKQADDHPRHDFWLTDPNVAPHMDCCASQGCPSGSCDILIRSKGEKTGDAFRAQIITEKFAEETTKLLDERDDVTRNFTLDDLNPAVHGSIVAASTDLRGTDR